MRRSDWDDRVELWKAKYGGQLERKEFNPFGSLISCKKCGKIKTLMQRHHKACDFAFASLAPDLYAARYIQFLPDDIDWLCKRCHNKFHNYIQPVTYELLNWAAEERRNGRKLTKSKLEKWRVRFLKKYNRWVSVKPRGKRVGSRKTKAKQVNPKHSFHPSSIKVRFRIPRLSIE